MKTLIYYDNAYVIEDVVANLENVMEDEFNFTKEPIINEIFPIHYKITINVEQYTAPLSISLSDSLK